jgi:hypothetical protein
MWKILWSSLGLLYLIIFWIGYYLHRQGGGFGQGWINVTGMRMVPCPVCKGHGWMTLKEQQSGTMAYVPLPRGEEGDRYHEPDDADALPCDACGGMGELLKELSRNELFRRLPLAIFHRRW